MSFRSRFVMAAFLGCELPNGSEVHHINGDPTDDDINNLALLPSKIAHVTLHDHLRRSGWKAKGAPDGTKTVVIHNVDAALWNDVKAEARRLGISVSRYVISVLSAAVGMEMAS